jgi:phosphoglycolate phosphatase
VLPFSTILFDLDGTLTDSHDGITRCVSYALDRLGYPPLSSSVLRTFIGPPLHGSFIQHCGMDEIQAKEAVAVFRERFGTIGMFENAVYPGIHDLLARLYEAGATMAVATSKAAIYAKQILEYFALAPYFRAIVGSELDGRRTDKSEIIAEVLASLPTVVSEKCIMVGDREHDILGARSHGLPAIAVTYGYGSLDELTTAHPLYMATSVSELAALLGV